MPAIVTDQGVVHYEVYGQGKPVILLHGWLGSWRLWQSTMEALAPNYRLYAIDFWGFGESGKRRENFTVDDFVSLVEQFMARLGIAQAPLVGHSMGGTVSLAAALKNPDRISKVVIIGSPIKGSSLAIPLQLAAIPGIARLLFWQMGLFTNALNLAAGFMCAQPGFAQLLTSDMNQTTLRSFFTSISSLKQVDLSSQIASLKMPVMGMFGGRDNIVSPRQAKLLQQALPSSRLAWYPAARHFVMLDEGSAFIADLKNFLENG